MHISLIKSVDLLIKEGYCPHSQIPSGETKTLNMWLPGVWNLVDEASFTVIFIQLNLQVWPPLLSKHLPYATTYIQNNKNVPSQSLIVNDSSRIFHCLHSLLSDHHGTIKLIVPWCPMVCACCMYYATWSMRGSFKSNTNFFYWRLKIACKTLSKKSPKSRYDLTSPH